MVREDRSVASDGWPLLDQARPWQLTVADDLVLRGGFLDRGRDTVLHFLPGTAFGCKIYWPFLSRLAAHYDLIWHDIHGHGDSDHGGREFAGWRQTVAWAQAALDQLALGERRLIGMGHSYGGCMTVIMAAQQPQRFAALLLTDPFMVPPEMEHPYRQLVKGLVENTRQRNPCFIDEEVLRAYLRSRPMFRDWSEPAIAAFIAFNMDRQPDGSLCLKCTPQIEASVYDDVVEGLWPAVEVLDTPAHLLSGKQTVPFFVAGHRKAAQLNPCIRRIEVTGGHNFMQEHPQASAETALASLGELITGASAPPR